MTDRTLKPSDDRPTSCWMVVDECGYNIGAIERSPAGNFYAFHGENICLGLFKELDEAADAIDAEACK